MKRDRMRDCGSSCPLFRVSRALLLAAPTQRVGALPHRRRFDDIRWLKLACGWHFEQRSQLAKPELLAFERVVRQGDPPWLPCVKSSPSGYTTCGIVAGDLFKLG